MQHLFSNGFETYRSFGSESADFDGVLPAELIMDPDEEGDELRHELVELEATLSRIDRRLDRHQSPPASYFAEIQIRFL